MAVSGGSKIPAWIKAQLFEPVLRETFTSYKQIKNFKVYPALGAGENYCTLMLRVGVDVELKDGSTGNVSYMLKVAQDSEMFREVMQNINMFYTEAEMYRNVVSEFERMYEEAGLDVKFSARFFELATDEDYILLEDLCMRGFKNADRLQGLDMAHTKCVLRKLAQWHAASAVRVARKGPYDEKYVHSYFKESKLDKFEAQSKSIAKYFLQCLKSYEGYEEYYEQVVNFQSHATTEMFKATKVDPSEFNVLNHGDCWSNNIMFQYDNKGGITETYFVDYQLPKYGSPAQDLFYFLLSSTQYQIKLSQFDYFIRYYHEQLVEHLDLLKYSRKLPSLRDIHIMLYRYGTWGYSTATGVMAAVLLDPTESANLDNFITDNEAGAAFKLSVYSNARYRKHMEAILPWLLNRGVFGC